MNQFKSGYKQYLRAMPHQILTFLKDEIRTVSPKDLGGFDDLAKFDLRDEVCFLIHLDSRVVGFVCIKFQGTERRLTKIYVTPNARRHGCATYVLRGLKISKATIALRHPDLIGICRKVGLTYHPRQEYPHQVADLHRTNEVPKHVRQSNPLPARQLG